MTTAQETQSTPNATIKITDLSHMILTHAVRTITGLPDAQGRPGQVSLAHDVARAFNKRGRKVAGAAPVGVGKSFAALAPACASAAIDGKRTIISTESLSLQSQIIEKDAPVVVESTRRVAGFIPKVAVLKGWSNYTCALKTIDSVQTLLTDAGVDFPNVDASLLSPATRTQHLDLLGELLTGNVNKFRSQLNVETESTVDLLKWAVNNVGETTAPCDRSSYPGTTNGQSWGRVSVSSDECMGALKCPLASVCAPIRARAEVAEADIVITNHAILSVQAAHNIPVAVGNFNIGQIDNIIIDEAHTLPENVRNQGSSEISKQTFSSVVRSLSGLFDVSTDVRANTLVEDGLYRADQLDFELTKFASGMRPGAVKDLGQNESPIDDLNLILKDWTGRANTMIKPYLEDRDTSIALAASRIKGRLEGLVSAIESAVHPVTGVARWVETPMDSGRGSVGIKSSPVGVGGMLHNNLWTSNVLNDEDGIPLVEERYWLDPQKEDGEDIDLDGPEPTPRFPLSVIAISGTLPQSMAYELGLGKKKVTKYPSPFEDAYGNSMVYVPRAETDEDLQTLGGSFYNADRPRLDANSHPSWAINHLSALVRGAGGRSLVLAAKADSGRFYVNQLRRLGAQMGFTVYSQWDGVPVPRLVAQWKADETSVLVGTKSLMTGTDAPGITCSLVVLDRVPRKPKNPVDDARVALLTENSDMDRWGADRMVYAQDAALLVEQCAGRLIRTGSDKGMVAVLDPRLLKSGKLSYPAQTRSMYMRSVESFENKTADLDKAVEFLQKITGAGMRETRQSA